MMAHARPLDSREYELTVRQEPKQARMCGVGGKGLFPSLTAGITPQFLRACFAPSSRSLVTSPNGMLCAFALPGKCDGDGVAPFRIVSSGTRCLTTR